MGVQQETHRPERCLSAYQQAFNLYTQGAGDAASDVLNRYGLNANAFASYNGAPVTRDDQAGVLSTAASLVASGNQEAAANLLKMYGLDSNAAGSYGTIAKRQLATQLAKAAATKSSRSSRSSGGSSKSGSGWTNSQLLTALGKYQSLKDDDPTKSVYANILASAGMLPDGDTAQQQRPELAAADRPAGESEQVGPARGNHGREHG